MYILFTSLAYIYADDQIASTKAILMRIPTVAVPTSYGANSWFTEFLEVPVDTNATNLTVSVAQNRKTVLLGKHCTVLSLTTCK